MKFIPSYSYCKLTMYTVALESKCPLFTHIPQCGPHTQKLIMETKRYSALASVTECEGTRLLYECEIRDWIIVCGGISSRTGSPSSAAGGRGAVPLIGGQYTQSRGAFSACCPNKCFPHRCALSSGNISQCKKYRLGCGRKEGGLGPDLLHKAMT